MNYENSEPDFDIPGYRFIERIGSGGYGEVWRVEVPGGLQKAVKIVYGRYDQERAASELRALERIKALRHPFLLSLERIEIVHDRLVIVTELADGSLRDRYQQCRAGGLPGIPRDELVGYLADAADALDYICQQHDLQHLDVKPENLLLVGGHVKLADFGLVKDLHTMQASMVGGMTPTYAAPELFQGNASTSSDQYSLAILYQELLTGTLPFAGHTAAELTLQHLNELPNLDALYEGDRFVLSQSLAKDPSHRFASCQELLTALKNQSAALAEPATATLDSTPVAAPEDFSPPMEPVDYGVTQVFDESQTDWTCQPQPVLLDLPAIGPIQPTAPAADVDQSFAISPTVVIGLGQSAGKVIRVLREQIAASYGPGALPLVRTMLIDTDPTSISAATRDGEAGLPLSPSDTLCMPLRRSHDYRNCAPELLRWMSRRWLYNVPRSLRTEGIRPLGRLALVDHSRQVAARVRMLLQEATDAEWADVPPATPPVRRHRLRVYLVGAVSGGTAGGVMLDVAYLVRATLQKMGLQDYKLFGIATHATCRETEKSELGRVNSVAWLNELQHYSRADVAFPGDAAAGLPALPPQVAPFDYAYMVEIGDRADRATFDRGIQSIANYLFVDSLTPAQLALDATRDSSDGANTQPAHRHLRSFAVVEEARLPEEVKDQWTRVLTTLLLRRWSDVGARNLKPGRSEDCGCSMQTTGPIVHGIANLLDRHQLERTKLSAVCKAAIEQQLGDNVVQKLRAMAVSAGHSPATLTLADGVELIHRLAHRQDDGQWMLEGESASATAATLAASRYAQLEAWILERLDMPTERLTGSRRAIEWLQANLDCQTDRLRSVAESLACDFDTLSQCDEDLPAGEVGRLVVRLTRLRIDQTAVGMAMDVVSRVQQSLGLLAERLRSAREAISAILSKWLHAEAESSTPQLPQNSDVALALNSLVVELDAALQEQRMHRLV